jgi:NAD(P)-dependent dehydrogenase (short-subunit alcohol dehydrogenase family)
MKDAGAKMTGEFEGKVALVTGGGSGIGRATAIMLANKGAKVVVADIDMQGGEKTVRMIDAKGSEATFVKTDVSQASEVEAMIKKAVETYGRLDCAHNNAGISPPGHAPIVEFSEQDWHRIIGINLTGVWLCMKYEIPHMLAQGGGAIVNTSSLGGVEGIPGDSGYTASKFGVVGITKAVALEYAEAGIRVNAVCPGYTRTPMPLGIIEQTDGLTEEMILTKVPMKRWGEPEEIAEMVVWLCSDSASFVTGQTLLVDGGLAGSSLA